MKRFITLLLSICLLLSLAGCGNNSSDAQAEKTAGSASDDAAQNTQNDNSAQEAAGNTSGKILVAYFTAAENSDVDAMSSASVTTIDGVAKGNVQAIADEIAAYTGGDLFSIQSSVEYPGNIDDLIDYAQDEQDADESPGLTTHIENLDEYDTVFIGYAGGIIGLN